MESRAHLRSWRFPFALSGPLSSLRLPLAGGSPSLLVVPSAAGLVGGGGLRVLSLPPLASPVLVSTLPAVVGASSLPLAPTAGVPSRLVLLWPSRAIPVI